MAPIECWHDLISQFIRAKSSRIFGLQRTLIFIQVSAECALVLSSLGLKANLMGGETQIKASSYKLTGHAKRGLRQSIERAKRSGVEVIESFHPLSEEEVNAIKEISHDFFSRHLPSARSTKFLNRELNPDDVFAGGCRLLLARKEGQIEGFAVLDPMRIQGKVRGYYANIIRSRLSAHPGTTSLLIHHSISMAKSESSSAVISLGLSPFHGLEQPKIFPHSSDKLKECMQWAFDRCNNFYPYKGISASKSKWGGGSTALVSNGAYDYPDPDVTYVPMFICHSNMSPAFDLVRIGYLNGMLDLNMVKNLRLLWRGEAPRGEAPRGEAPAREQKKVYI